MSQIIINGQPLYQVDLPEMTLAQWLALPVAERPKEWIRTDADYTDIPAENVSYEDVEINASTDLNDCSDEGKRYYCLGAVTPINAPSTSINLYNMVVWNVHSGAISIQFLYTSNGNKLFFRGYYGNHTWQPWQVVSSSNP